MTRQIAARVLAVDEGQDVVDGAETPSLESGSALDAVLQWVGDGVWIELDGANRVNLTGRRLLALGPEHDPNDGQGISLMADLEGNPTGSRVLSVLPGEDTRPAGSLPGAGHAP